MGILSTLDRTGDTKVIWDPANDDEVANARATFQNLKTKGFAGYRVKKSGDKGELIREFDPSAQAIIMAPPLVGG